MTDWLTIRRGKAPLVLSFPHTGTDIPAEFEPRLVSPWLARKDADWWIEKLYDFGVELDATMVRTGISRTIIDVNRDPSGVSLYPGQATTGLCPLTSFDGEPLYKGGQEPDEAEISSRRETYFRPYHDALAAEIARLRQSHRTVVLYDCHSIRSAIPRLFEDMLPVFNIGTNSGAACAPELAAEVERRCAESEFPSILNGRFKGGYITRQYGKPAEGVHAVQMELGCRGYMEEPLGPVSEANWPTPYDPAYAAPIRAVLTGILQDCLRFAEQEGAS
ncbi:MAG: N-formylglutamate deformylase [Alphaproteobacteria bacterium]|nr:N-formylglutamate deformylase [Alphaproteobacteria bacterium]MBU0799237.1 N-formylglutamate deformylase [Alphaproteobacteria bacterium]MBU0887625.1 N-formylglutamate deformylase [Alphaproteobacteria bacterium]MBU1812948.1 N-formylglutamate deformylase [Alphaproteobacteria bacterium]